MTVTVAQTPSEWDPKASFSSSNSERPPSPCHSTTFYPQESHPRQMTSVAPCSRVHDSQYNAHSLDGDGSVLRDSDLIHPPEQKFKGGRKKKPRDIESPHHFTGITGLSGPGFGRPPGRFHAKRGWPRPKAQAAPHESNMARGPLRPLTPV